MKKALRAIPHFFAKHSFIRTQKRREKLKVIYTRANIECSARGTLLKILNDRYFIFIKKASRYGWGTAREHLVGKLDDVDARTVIFDYLVLVFRIHIDPASDVGECVRIRSSNLIEKRKVYSLSLHLFRGPGDRRCGRKEACVVWK